MTFDPTSVEVTCVTHPSITASKVCGYSDHFSKLKPSYHTLQTDGRTDYVQSEWSHSLFSEQSSGETYNKDFGARNPLKFVKFGRNGQVQKPRTSNSPALGGSLPPGHYFSRQACKISRINEKKIPPCM